MISSGVSDYMSLDFPAEVTRLLTKTEIPFRVIAEDCNVSMRWLYDMQVGRFSKDPGIRKTLRVYEYLSGRKVKAA